MNWTHDTLFMYPNWKWIGLLIAIVLGLIVKTLCAKILILLKKITEKTETKWDDELFLALEKPSSLIFAGAFWLFSINVLDFAGKFQQFLVGLIHILIGIALVWAFYRLVDVFADYLKKITEKTETPIDDQLMNIARKTMRVFVIVFGVLLLIQNMGVNVMSVFAGLGLGGLAFALAAKDTCSNLFGSMMILMDRPFRVGDWIVIGSLEGAVEEIGLRSTRIRTFYDSLVSVPNATMANSNIDNMGLRKKRRVKTRIGLTYNTEPEKMLAFLEGIKKIIHANKYTDKNDFQIVFNDYSESALEVMLYFFLIVTDWTTELRARQDIFLEILKLAKETGVKFAFPTQTVHLDSVATSFDRSMKS